MQYLGETFLFPVVNGYSLAAPSTNYQSIYPCDGATLPLNPPGGSLDALAALIGVDTSGTRPTVTLPDLAAPIPGLRWFIANSGVFPSGTAYPDDCMPLFGQISLMPVVQGRGYDPIDVLPCDGRTLQVEEYVSMFFLLGTTFGGDGEHTFQMPDLSAPNPALFYGMCTYGAFPHLVPVPQEVGR
ncbi:MAG: phage tail protein [Microthrixaceae bacterium]